MIVARFSGPEDTLILGDLFDDIGEVAKTAGEYGTKAKEAYDKYGKPVAAAANALGVKVPGLPSGKPAGAQATSGAKDRKDPFAVATRNCREQAKLKPGDKATPEFTKCIKRYMASQPRCDAKTKICLETVKKIRAWQHENKVAPALKMGKQVDAAGKALLKRYFLATSVLRHNACSPEKLAPTCGKLDESLLKQIVEGKKAMPKPTKYIAIGVGALALGVGAYFLIT